MSPANQTLLVVEDDDLIRRFLTENLIADGYTALAAQDAAEAEHLLRTNPPDLAILDLGLPDLDGIDLLRRIRRLDRTCSRMDPEVPILILSGRGGELERLRGFETGCDDFVVKPFSYQELRARINVILRRRAEQRSMLGRVRVGPLIVDPAGRRVWLRDVPVNLSNKEFALLRTLASDPTKVFTRDELLRDVWGYRELGRTRTLDTHAARLRHKLGGQGDEFVVNSWGVGYRLVEGQVTE